MTMLAVGLTAMLLLFLLTDLGVTGWAQPALLLRDVCQDDGRVDTLLVIRPVWHTSTNVAVSSSSSFPAHQVSPSASFLGQQHTACAPCMLPLAPPPQRHTHDPPPHVPLTTQHACHIATQAMPHKHSPPAWAAHVGGKQPPHLLQAPSHSTRSLSSVLRRPLQVAQKTCLTSTSPSLSKACDGMDSLGGTSEQ